MLQKADEPGIIATSLRSDGEYFDELYTDGGTSMKKLGVLKMQGKEVFKHAVEKMSASILEILAANNFSIVDLNWLVPHQANLRIMSAIGERIGLDASKVIEAVSKHANTSAASIPLALCEGVEKFKKGDLIAFTALGGGFSWGSALLKW